MLRRTSLIGAVVVVFLATSVASAQTQKRQRGGAPGGQGGQGGQQRGQFGGGFAANSSTLLSMPEVQKELGLSEDQKGLIGDMIKDLRGSAGQGFQALQGLSADERREKLAELQKQGEERNKKVDDLTKTVLDAKQLARLEELKLQRDGINALSRSEVATKLGLTDDQKEKIKKIRDDARPDPSSFQNLRNATKEDRDAAAAKAQERRTKTQADTLAVLTAEQKSSWEKMQGKKFEFPAPGRRATTGAGA